MAISADQISKVLSEIQGRVPLAWKKMAFTESKLTPNIEFVAEEALKSDTVSEAKKEQIRTLQATGEFSKMKVTENHKVTKQIDEFVEREIKKEIKAGRLPPRNQIRNLPHIKEMHAKINRQSN